MESIEKNQQEIEAALKHVFYVKNIVGGMGNNDTERGDFERIENDLRNNKITPEEAIVQADAIQANKLEI